MSKKHNSRKTRLIAKLLAGLSCVGGMAPMVMHQTIKANERGWEETDGVVGEWTVESREKLLKVLAMGEITVPQAEFEKTFGTKDPEAGNPALSERPNWEDMAELNAIQILDLGKESIQYVCAETMMGLTSNRHTLQDILNSPLNAALEIPKKVDGEDRTFVKLLDGETAAKLVIKSCMTRLAKSVAKAREENTQPVTVEVEDGKFKTGAIGDDCKECLDPEVVSVLNEELSSLLQGDTRKAAAEYIQELLLRSEKTPKNSKVTSVWLDEEGHTTKVGVCDYSGVGADLTELPFGEMEKKITNATKVITRLCRDGKLNKTAEKLERWTGCLNKLLGKKPETHSIAATRMKFGDEIITSGVAWKKFAEKCIPLLAKVDGPNGTAGVITGNDDELSKTIYETIEGHADEFKAIADGQVDANLLLKGPEAQKEQIEALLKQIQTANDANSDLKKEHNAAMEKIMKKKSELETEKSTLNNEISTLRQEKGEQSAALKNAEEQIPGKLRRFGVPVLTGVAGIGVGAALGASFLSKKGTTNKNADLLKKADAKPATKPATNVKK